MVYFERIVDGFKWNLCGSTCLLWEISHKKSKSDGEDNSPCYDLKCS
jgi:hypothetical protein